jgi:hypothetical protein
MQQQLVAARVSTAGIFESCVWHHVSVACSRAVCFWLILNLHVPLLDIIVMFVASLVISASSPYRYPILQPK